MPRRQSCRMVSSVFSARFFYFLHPLPDPPVKPPPRRHAERRCPPGNPTDPFVTEQKRIGDFKQCLQHRPLRRADELTQFADKFGGQRRRRIGAIGVAFERGHDEVSLVSQLVVRKFGKPDAYTR